MVDNVPVHALPPGAGDGITLVLLTRRYPRPLPQTAHRFYIQPSHRVPVSGWDYTNPHGIRVAYELGRNDARQLRVRMGERGLATFLENTHG